MKRLLIILLFYSNFTFSQNEQQQTLVKEYNKQKTWLINLLDISYLNKFIIENNGNIKESIHEYELRIRRLFINYKIENYEEINNKINGACAYYDYRITHLPNYYPGPTGAIHEFTHQMTDGDFNITPYAKLLYQKAFDSTKAINPILINKRTYLQYSSDPTELDARKKQLEFEMERLGIKKYKDKFKLKHYKIILKYIKKGLFVNQGAIDFIKLIKPNYIIQIMNTIA